MLGFETLNKSDIINIHEKLVLDAINSNDPISPPGVRDEGLLESAIQRQFSGYGSKYKYDNPILNSVSLCYGICCNHSLHNGNKRTALVALLCHLDKNGYTFNEGTDQKHLYTFMVNVAGHKMVYKKKKKKTHDQSDSEIEVMEEWVRKRTRRIKKGEKSISYQELEKLLRQHDIYFENHKNNKVDLIKRTTKTVEKRIFRNKTIDVIKKVANIPYWPGRSVGKKLITSIRKQAALTHKDGVDSTLFYGDETLPDDFIQKYKNTLSRLAKT
ncbi:type II toxin-antitoxin system death-on-curing family toxin [Kiloniella majae]|uniref:type II toxin-antitoxin system death-on-curing family toxin n=1 Tax=Kiloniella majae TaxID=1938558 RepID=UPI000A2774D5|nr:type II toxin-antitoxin system death-on-curing family toxin [Kiloniella majae]